MNLPRRLLTLSARFQSTISCEEIRIPVPWGHVAGKWWGPQDKRPILSIHGWQDSAGTFDRLIPLLPKNVGYLAIDLPGHGFSSRLPPGIFYSGISEIISIKLIKEFFEWKKVSIIAHSSSALMSYTYSFIYSDDVDFFICIDPLQYLTDPFDNATYRKLLNTFLKYDKQIALKIEPNSYTFEDLKKKVFTASGGSMDLDQCKYILQRSVLAVENKPGFYYYNNDPRLMGYYLFNWDANLYRKAVKLIKFPVLLAIIHTNKEYMGLKVFSMEDLMDASDFFESHKLEGTHHLHLNKPESVAGIFNDFIKKHDTNDRSVEFDMARIRHC